MYSNLINLTAYFKNCSEEYCIIRIPKYFPNYYKNDDLDILCRDKSKLVNYTISFFEKLNNNNININIHHPNNGHHSHVDILDAANNKLDFKFDFIDSFSMYKKNHVHANFKNIVLNSKIHNKSVFVPNLTHEMIIRMLEYLEYNDTNPEKKKHLDFINQQNKNHKDEYKKKFNKYITKSFNLKNKLKKILSNFMIFYL